MADKPLAPLALLTSCHNQLTVNNEAFSLHGNTHTHTHTGIHGHGQEYLHMQKHRDTFCFHVNASILTASFLLQAMTVCLVYLYNFTITSHYSS